MKKNKNILIITILLGVVALILIFSQKSGTLGHEYTDFAIDDTSNVTRIFMADKQNHVVDLRRVSPGNWTANKDFRARTDAIDILLKTMLNVQVMEPLPKAGIDNVIRRLAANSVKVEIYQEVYRINLFNWLKLFKHEKMTKSYFVGSSTMENLGTYMLLNGSKTPSITYLPGFRGYISGRYTAKIDDWRDHTVFNYRIADIQSVKVEFTETPDQSYQINNENNRQFTLTRLADNQRVMDYDTVKVLDFLASFYSIKFETLLSEMPKPFLDSLAVVRPLHTLTITEKSGKINKVKTYHRANPDGATDDQGNLLPFDLDRMYAFINQDKDFVLVQYYVFDNILRPLNFFLKATATPAPGKKK